MRRIFISHAVVDKPLVDEFVTLLQTGLDLTRDQIFCSSIEGMKCRAGKSFVEYIREQLSDADFVIMIITPAYYESVFCNCELGASWITAKDAYPFLVKPIGYDKLKGVLHGVHCGKIEDESDLNDLLDRLQDAGIVKPSVARWEVRRDAFLMKLPELVKDLTQSTVVPVEEHKKLQAKYEAAQDEMKTQGAEIKDLQEKIEELRKAKDKAEVKKILAKGKKEGEQLEELTRAFKEATREVPNCVVEAMYHTQDSETYVGPTHWNNEQTWEAISDAEDRGFLILDGNFIKVKSSAPKLRKAFVALGELETFMNKLSEEFVQDFEEEHEIEFSLSNIDFWKECLGMY